jgi:predicted NBD/HSP70 family sugar kinase
MNVLVVDVGGTNIKLLATGQKTVVKIPSGPTMTPKRLVRLVRKSIDGWKYSRVSIGYPGVVLHGKPVIEPKNLGRGWVGFDFGKAFGCPAKVVNDAAMQALGSYRGGRMLFLGLGTGLGSALISTASSSQWSSRTCPTRKAAHTSSTWGLPGSSD